MAEALKAAARQLPSFKLGKKQVFLPSHVITLFRNTRLPPNEAQFKVPLTFTKFDLRDYLWNLYNVETTKIRSHVKQKALNYRDISRKRIYRPQPEKIMIVELAKPFQWPELPENLEPWSHELWHRRQDVMTKGRNAMKNENLKRPEQGMKSRQPRSATRDSLATLANKLLSGEVKWSNDVVLDPKWDELRKGEERVDELDEAAILREADREGSRDLR